MKPKRRVKSPSRSASRSGPRSVHKLGGYAAIIEDATALAAARNWGAAAIAFARAASLATEQQSWEAARLAWDAAGEAWRRDDKLDSAARALKLALAQSKDVKSTAIGQIKLSGVLGEMGKYEEAQALCLRAAKEVEGTPLRPLAVDTWINTLLALGDKAACRPLVSELLEMPGPAGLAGKFRSAQLCRLDGEFAEAELHLSVLIDGLEGLPGAEAGVAGAWAELGECALLRGHFQSAAELMNKAFDGQQEAARGALKWRAEAARIRVLVAGGLGALLHTLDEGIEYARERDLTILQGDLVLARGMATAARRPVEAAADFEVAAAVADEAGSPLRGGRARLEWALRIDGPLPRRLSVVERAAEQLVSSRPWTARAMFAKARLIRDSDPARAHDAGSRALARFNAMEMEADAADALQLVRLLH